MELDDSVEVKFITPSIALIFFWIVAISSGVGVFLEARPSTLTVSLWLFFIVMLRIAMEFAVVVFCIHAELKKLRQGSNYALAPLPSKQGIIRDETPREAGDKRLVREVEPSGVIVYRAED